MTLRLWTFRFAFASPLVFCAACSNVSGTAIIRTKNAASGTGAAPQADTHARPIKQPMPQDKGLQHADKLPPELLHLLPQDGVNGILSCPTVPLPLHEVASRSQAAEGNHISSTQVPEMQFDQLSNQFQRACAGCHGSEGEGKTGYPSLRGTLALSDFQAIIRSGKGNMPAFSSTYLPDSVLESDFRILSRGSRPVDTAKPRLASEWVWSQAEFERIRADGLKAWRQPDSHGAACANCHTPDGVDLAIIGYQDEAILRRARQHLEPEDAARVVDFIHAQRRHFKITTPCSPKWRPFQPGGEPLPGKTPDEQDLAFLKQLETMGLELAVGRVVTLADARRALAQLQQVDIRKLKVGIELPRWTEDGFNGKAHESFNDYIPTIPRIPNDRAKFHEAEDRYITQPSDENFFALVDAIGSQTNSGDYLQKSSAMVRNCTHWGNTAGGFLERTSILKKRSVLISQHFFRRELTKEAGRFLEQPLSPFPNHPGTLNPFFHLAGDLVEPPCYDDSDRSVIFDALPESLRKELPEQDQSERNVKHFSADLSHSWMTLGQIYDPTLFMVEPIPDNKLHYWSHLNFRQRQVHEPFFSVHRLASAMAYHPQHEKLFEGVKSPQMRSFHASFNVDVLLDWKKIYQQFVGQVTPVASGELVRANRFKGNILRMLLLLQKDLLEKGAAVHQVEDKGHTQGFDAIHREHWVGFARDFKTLASDPRLAQLAPDLKRDEQLYGVQTEQLLEQVRNLVHRAPRR